MIGHGGLLRTFSFARPIRGSGMSRGSTPRHAQTAGDLGFAVQFNAETPWHFAQLRYPRVEWPQSNNRNCNGYWQRKVL